jgi:uncharacterized membrane protein
MFSIWSKSTTAAKDAHSRSLAKAVTWRLTGSIDTFILSFLITGSIKIAGSISAVEVVTKILLFYFHERVWALIPWGRRKPAAKTVSQDEVSTDYKGPVLVDTCPQHNDNLAIVSVNALEAQSRTAAPPESLSLEPGTNPPLAHHVAPTQRNHID